LIGEAIRAKSRYHVLVLRSTVPTGATLSAVVPEIEAACDRMLGEGFGVCVSPAFLRAGLAVADFLSPAATVVGIADARSREIVEPLFKAMDAGAVFTSIEAAEALGQAGRF
jgi:UDP-glucose 6-dehydrogenase